MSQASTTTVLCSWLREVYWDELQRFSYHMSPLAWASLALSMHQIFRVSAEIENWFDSETYTKHTRSENHTQGIYIFKQNNKTENYHWPNTLNRDIDKGFSFNLKVLINVYNQKAFFLKCYQNSKKLTQTISKFLFVFTGAEIYVLFAALKVVVRLSIIINVQIDNFIKLHYLILLREPPK